MLVVFILGLIVGSFLNVVVLRSLQGISIISPRSNCPSCQTTLSPIELIPIISYLLFRGRCRTCRVKISILYPLGELLTAILFVLLYAKIGFTPELLPLLLLFSLLQLALFTDLKQMLILNQHTYFFMLIMIVIRIFIRDQAIYSFLLAGVLVFLFFIILNMITNNSVGGGDIKLFTAIGFAVGIESVILSLFLSIMIGTIIGMILLISGKIKRKEPMPFAPAIFLGTVSAVLYGDEMIRWYIQFL